MTPPLPYRKKWQLSHNLVLVITCMLASAGILTYLFYPDKKEELPVYSAPPQLTEKEAEANHSPEPEDDYEYSSSRDELSREELEKLAPWEATFARMPKEQRLAFATSFAKAKLAYSREQWAVCLSMLNECELIYAGSPNVWNLRSCALLESGALNEAEIHIKRSLELNAEDSVALLNQSDLFMLRRDFKGCIPVLEKQCETFSGEDQMQMHDIFAFRLLLCHLMLRHEMEARSIVTGVTPMRDSPLYYFSEAAFRLYKGDNNGALEPLRTATTIYGNGGVTASYRQWMNKCGLKEKYIDKRRN